MPNALPRVAIATGDPAGIGPEVGLKTALDPAVNAMCRPIVVGDPACCRITRAPAAWRITSM